MSSGDDAAQRLRDVLRAVASISADLSMDGLLDRVLREAGQLVGAEHGYFDVIDRRFGRSAAYGTHGVVDRDRLDRQLLVDLLAPSAPRPETDDADTAERVTFIGVPVGIHDHVFGHLYLVGAASSHGFSREDEDVTRALATAAGVVIENARLYENGERQRMWLEAAAGITAALLSPISRSTGLQLVADRAREVADADFVCLLTPVDEATLVVEAVSGVPEEGVLGERIDALRSVVGDSARLRRTVVVPNTRLEPRYEHQKTPGWPDLGSLMVLPLRSGVETGALIVGWLTGHHTDRWGLDPDLPQRFADQAALVLQVARAQEDQARLAVFVDRDRIGRDLHDLVIQRLFGIGLVLGNTARLITSDAATERVSTVIDDIDRTIKDIRRTIFALSSPSDSRDVRAELEQVLVDASELLGFSPELRLIGPVNSVLTDEIRAHLIAVLREAMSNIIRHADADRVRVELDVSDNVTLTIDDDGVGIDHEPAGSGLRNIRERAALLGGTCVIETQLDLGTRIIWTAPRRKLHV